MDYIEKFNINNMDVNDYIYLQENKMVTDKIN